MINAILTGIINLIISLVSVVLAPFDALIQSVLPDLSTALSYFAGFLNVVGDSIGWCISLTGISSTALGLIVSYYTFKLTAPMLFYMIKLALSWYNKIKP